MAALGYQLPTEEQLRQNLVSLQVGPLGPTGDELVLFGMARVDALGWRSLWLLDCTVMITIIYTTLSVVVIITISYYY